MRQYWRQQLDGAVTVLELPGDYERPLKQTFNGDVTFSRVCRRVMGVVQSKWPSEPAIF